MTAARYSQVVTAVGQGGGIVQNRDELFTGQTCGVCLIPTGERTDAPIRIEFQTGYDRRYDGIMAMLEERPRGPTFYLYSAEFLEALSADQRNAFRWREAVASKPTPTTKHFFEIVEAQRVVPPVRLRDGTATVWECPRCGRLDSPQYREREHLPQWLQAYVPNAAEDLRATVGGQTPRAPYLFVTGELLPEPLPPAFAVGESVRGLRVAVNDLTIGYRRTPKANAPRGFILIERSFIGIIRSADAD
jgi:hypothetical protein